MGSVLAWYRSTEFHWDIFLWAIIGVTLIMLTTYYAGEYWDIHEDQLSGLQASTPFSGGSQVIQRGLLPRSKALWASILCMIAALSIGLLLHIHYLTGVWTLPMGLLGLVGGFFYSTPPIRWVSRGVGELWIAVCYGWLPLVSAYYLQHNLPPILIHWIALPIAITIFNVILLNEFPDYSADFHTGKRNLVVRLGQSRAAKLYIVLNVGSWVAVIFTVINGVHWIGLLFYLPVFLLSLYTTSSMLQGAWQTPQTLVKLCGITILINLGTTGSMILTYLGG